MSKRKPLGNKLRFEVFKRDSFACQYCGRKAPDVVLQADHITPVASGGTNEILNLITSCFECNSGKSDKKLSDNSTIERQRNQLGELQARREQIDMLLQWKRGMADLDSEAAEQLAELWRGLAPGWTFSEGGFGALRALILKCGISDVADAMREAAASYLRFQDDGKVTRESWTLAWDKVQRIAKLSPALREKPYLKDVFYIRAIVCNQFCYAKKWQVRELLESAMQLGVSSDALKSIAFDASSWTDWLNTMDDVIAGAEGSRAAQ